eukprot:GAFH01003545.1.p2 GENE.GAFH01003545.1~~GAFH01003545.1.p2  ORF type:complete len:283 (-),score=64.07 GAFH01003545.1:80-841(-)
MEAVKKGSTAVGVRGQNAVVLALEKQEAKKLQDTRTVRKICVLDSHLCLVFAGLSADARVLINKARMECQSFRLTMDEPCSVEYISRYIAGIQQKYTQSGGARPFGISTMVAGFDLDNQPHLYMTDPGGTNSEWKANAIGRNYTTVREFLEKHYVANLPTDDAVLLALKALLEVVDSGPKNLEIALMEPGRPMRLLSDEEVGRYVERIEAEKAAAAAAQAEKQRALQAQADAAAPAAPAPAPAPTQPASEPPK